MGPSPEALYTPMASGGRTKGRRVPASRYIIAADGESPDPPKCVLRIAAVGMAAVCVGRGRASGQKDGRDKQDEDETSHLELSVVTLSATRHYPLDYLT